MGLGRFESGQENWLTDISALLCLLKLPFLYWTVTSYSWASCHAHSVLSRVMETREILSSKFNVAYKWDRFVSHCYLAVSLWRPQRHDRMTNSSRVSARVTIEAVWFTSRWLCRKIARLFVCCWQLSGQEPVTSSSGLAVDSSDEVLHAESRTQVNFWLYIRLPFDWYVKFDSYKSSLLSTINIVTAGAIFILNNVRGTYCRLSLLWSM